MLTLYAPVPAAALAFEDVFFGKRAELIRLSQARVRAARAARALAGDSTRAADSATALRTYVHAWRTFAAALAHEGASARTALPFEVAWHVRAPGDSPGDEPRLYTDASLAFESACATHALVAALQRAGDAASLAEARTELVRLRTRTLEPLVAPAAGGARAPLVLSPHLCSALEAALDGQAAVAAVVGRLQHGAAASSALVRDLFAARDAWTRAADVLPTVRAFSVAARTSGALGSRYLAEALVGAPDIADAVAGVAVALVRAAVRDEPDNKAVREYADALESRNRLVFGDARVPERVAVHLDERAPGSTGARDIEAREREPGGGVWDVFIAPANDGELALAAPTALE